MPHCMTASARHDASWPSVSHLLRSIIPTSACKLAAVSAMGALCANRLRTFGRSRSLPVCRAPHPPFAHVVASSRLFPLCRPFGCRSLHVFLTLPSPLFLPFRSFPPKPAAPERPGTNVLGPLHAFECATWADAPLAAVSRHIRRDGRECCTSELARRTRN